jgi:hypothetical protein
MEVFMKKNLTILGVMACLLIMAFMFGCTISTSGYDNPNNPNNPTNLKFKASNVVFRNSTVKASDEFTDQKVYADDVVLNNANTSLTADNVQGAFEETQPKLSEIIVGEWDVKGYISNSTSGIVEDFEADIYSGSISFNEDGTFSFTKKGWILFSWENIQPNLLRNSIKYSLYNDSILSITWWGEMDWEKKPWTYNNIITFETITQNKLIYKHPLGSIILTRKQ